jgi:hypothetical protein
MPHEFNFENILRCVVRNASRHVTARWSKHATWGIVADICGVGSTSAIELCKRFDIDPHKKLPEAELCTVARLCGAEFDDGEQSSVETCAKMMCHIEAAIAD